MPITSSWVFSFKCAAASFIAVLVAPNNNLLGRLGLPIDTRFRAHGKYCQVMKNLRYSEDQPDVRFARRRDETAPKKAGGQLVLLHSPCGSCS